MTNTPKNITNVRLPNDLAAQLRDLAAKHDRSLSAELREAVRLYIATHRAQS